MDAITDAELIELARGMAADTATLFDDCARRCPTMAFTLYILAEELRAAARDLSHARPPIDPSPADSTGS